MARTTTAVDAVVVLDSSLPIVPATNPRRACTNFALVKIVPKTSSESILPVPVHRTWLRPVGSKTGLPLARHQPLGGTSSVAVMATDQPFRQVGYPYDDLCRVRGGALSCSHLGGIASSDSELVGNVAPVAAVAEKLTAVRDSNSFPSRTA